MRINIIADILQFYADIWYEIAKEFRPPRQSLGKCGGCNAHELTSIWDSWCPECELLLCKYCVSHHDSGNHKLLK